MILPNFKYFEDFNDKYSHKRLPFYTIFLDLWKKFHILNCTILWLKNIFFFKIESKIF